FVKRAFPSPVPMVITPQCSTSVIKGASLKPCTTASLCIKTDTSCPLMVGMAALTRCGKLKDWHDQLPGRFCPPVVIEPSSWISPGHVGFAALQPADLRIGGVQLLLQAGDLRILL